LAENPQRLIRRGVAVGTPVTRRPPQVSRPREFHPQPLAKPDRRLSTHPASIIQPVLVAPPHTLSWPTNMLSDTTPLLGPRYQASSLLRVVPPLCTGSVLSPLWRRPLVTCPGVAFATPQYDRFPCSTHLPVLRSCHLYAGHRLIGNRYPSDCSQDGSATLVSMSLYTISTRHQWFTCVHLLNPHQTQYSPSHVQLSRRTRSRRAVFPHRAP
jgi:hypothetical protein